MKLYDECSFPIPAITRSQRGLATKGSQKVPANKRKNKIMRKFIGFRMKRADTCCRCSPRSTKWVTCGQKSQINLESIQRSLNKFFSKDSLLNYVISNQIVVAIFTLTNPASVRSGFGCLLTTPYSRTIKKEWRKISCFVIIRKTA